MLVTGSGVLEKFELPTAWRLNDRVAFVTGAGGAIGRAVATSLARAGASVVCADLDLDAASATVSALGSRGEPVELDVTDKVAVSAAVTATAERHGRLDVMCNLAGIAGQSQLIADLTEDAFDLMFAVHFKGVLYGCQAAARIMTAAHRGAIVNMSSEAIDIHPPTIASYAVSKAGISMLTRILASEIAADGVRANAVAPSFIPTPLSLRRYPDEEGRRAYLDWWRAESPLGALCTEEDVAMQVLYLASDASAFVTGQTLRANGGITMPW